MIARSPWNQESVDLVIEMYNQHKSTRLISIALGEIGYPMTRNSVIGKIFRLKLPPRPEREADGPEAISRPRRARPNAVITRSLRHRSATVRSDPLNEPPPPSDTSDMVPFLQIRDGQCKAILAYEEGQLSRALCCGRKTRRLVNGYRVVFAAWCDSHQEIYTQESYR